MSPTAEEFIDIRALLEATERKAQLETERLQEWKQVKEMIKTIHLLQQHQRASWHRVEASLLLLAQYLAALASDDKNTMLTLAQQAKDIAVQMGGIRTGDSADVGADRDIVAGDRRR